MAMYPNARHMSLIAGRHFGPGPGLENKFRDRSDRFNIYTCATFNKQTSFPSGYGVHTPVPCYSVGGISSVMRAVVSLRANCDGSMGLTASGSADITLDAIADARAVGVLSGYAATSVFAQGEGDVFTWAVFAQGVAPVSLSANGYGRLAAQTSGVATVGLTCAGLVGALANVGAVAPSSVSGSGLIRANGWLNGTTADQGVTPQGIAAAVVAQLTEVGLTPEQEQLINQILLTTYQIQTKIDATF